MSWAPYTDAEIPPGCSEKLKREITALGLVSRQVRVSVDQYYLFKQLARRRAIVAAINGSSVEYGTRVVVGAVVRDLIIGLGSIFDPDPGALDLVRVLNALTHPENLGVFRSYHSSWSVPFDTDAGVQHLQNRSRRFRHGKLRDAIQRIRDLRSKAIAHIDMEPVFGKGRAKVWELDYVLAGAAGAVVYANLFATGRCIDRAQMAALSRRNIAEFSSALMAGSKPAPVADPL